MLSFFFHLSVSWWGEPHIAIAYLAESMMSEDQLSYVNRVLASAKSEKAVFHDVANWHDDLKPVGLPVMVPWHFRNQPIPNKDFEVKVFPITFNVTTVNRYCLDAIYDKSTKSVWMLNFCFRSLAHFVGDAHCPVHSAGKWDAIHPEGDRGGNSWRNVCDFDPRGACKTLHMMWDSALLDYQTFPFESDEEFKEFEKNYTSLWTEFPPETSFGSSAHSIDPTIWQKDAYRVATDYVYGKFSDDGQVDSAYIKAGAPQAKKLISVGGLRLGEVFKHFFEVREGTLPKIVRERSIASEVIAWCLDAVLLVISIIYTVLLVRSNFGGYTFSPLMEP